MVRILSTHMINQNIALDQEHVYLGLDLEWKTRKGQPVFLELYQADFSTFAGFKRFVGRVGLDWTLCIVARTEDPRAPGNALAEYWDEYRELEFLMLAKEQMNYHRQFKFPKLEDDMPSFGEDLYNTPALGRYLYDTGLSSSGSKQELEKPADHDQMIDRVLLGHYNRKHVAPRAVALIVTDVLKHDKWRNSRVLGGLFEHWKTLDPSKDAIALLARDRTLPEARDWLVKRFKFVSEQGGFIGDHRAAIKSIVDSYWIDKDKTATKEKIEHYRAQMDYELYHGARTGLTADVLNLTFISLMARCYAEILAMIDNGVGLKFCENCKEQLFMPLGNRKKYCLDCTQGGAQTTYRDSLMKNIDKGDKRREYKRKKTQEHRNRDKDKAKKERESE